MIKALEDISASFKVSEPIFTGEIRYEGAEIRFTIKSPYSPDPNDYTDCVAKLVAEQYSERFDRRKCTFINDTNMCGVWANIVYSLRRLYEVYGGLKNPRSSKHYKWLNAIANRQNHIYGDGIIALYRYMRLHAAAEDNRFHSGASNPHVKNILAILEKIRDKDV